MNISKACELTHKDAHDFIPVTFIIDMTSRYKLDSMLDQFYTFFNTLEKYKNQQLSVINQQLAQLPNK